MHKITKYSSEGINFLLKILFLAKNSRF